MKEPTSFSESLSFGVGQILGERLDKGRAVCVQLSNLLWHIELVQPSMTQKEPVVQKVIELEMLLPPLHIEAVPDNEVLPLGISRAPKMFV